MIRPSLKYGVHAVILLTAQVAMADVTPFTYRLGAVAALESEHQIVLHAHPPVTVAILPGGKTWPILSLGASGRIYAGNTVIEPATGRSRVHPGAILALPHDIDVATRGNGYEFRKDGKRCALSLRQLGMGADVAPVTALQNRHIAFSNTTDTLLALITQFDADDKVARYVTERIDIGQCRVVDRQAIGNPDLLIELGSSAQGGWWITGSIEQTLLQSHDGRHWRKATLPKGLSSLISAYVVDARETWLAAILGAGDASPYLLVYSDDGGHTWRNVRANDPALQRMPVGWLEGQKRRVQ